MANRNNVTMPKDDESRWLEIEQDEFVLDQVPNVTAEFNTHNSPSETVGEVQENFEQNFNRLHRIADKIKHTIREHLNSESSTCSDVTDLDTPMQDPLVNHYADQSLDEFKEELRLKREARQNAVQQMRDEITTLREKLEIERNITKHLRNNKELGKEEKSALDGAANNDDNAKAVATRNRQAIIELANAQLSLQMANSENISLRSELAAVKKQCTTLKEVVACCKQMMAIKEEQCGERSPLEITQSEDLRHKMANALERLRVSELKQKLNEIEKSFEEHETKIMSDNLRQEYEKQLLNIRQLRQLYEERQRIAAAEYENLQRLISIKRDELAAEQAKTQKLAENNQQLKYDLDLANNELECLRDECKEHRYEKTSLKDELGAVNTLFSQMVLGFNGKNNLDIDRLMLMLEENRALLNEMASKELNCSDGATLPKLLFELVQQAIVSDNSNDGDNVSAMFTKCENEENDNRNESNENVEKDGEVTELPNNTNHNDNSTLGDHLLISNEWEGAGAGAVAVAVATAASNNNDDDNVVIVSSSNRHTKKLSRQHSTNNNNKKPSSVAAFLNLHESNVVGKHTTAQEIIGNLPKVWRVLMELLSHHNIEHVQFDKNGNGEDCYTSTDMSGAQRSQPELSVSKTYLKLKDLILEKKSLVKETKRLKTLNSHLEYRLNEQEKRLSAVSLELTKTWHLVGKMQRQHRQLHTQEQILRYQLQQKRRLLSELKEELEYCRRKWAEAKAKNDETQIQCDYLRREFAKRKLYDLNNSGESGYSDSGGHSAEEDEEAFDVAAKYNAMTLSSKSFEHSRKIKRMQSTSPGRAELCTARAHLGVLRCNSAPPTYNWCNSTQICDADTFSDMACGYASNVPSQNSAKNLENISQEEMRAPRIKRLEEQCKALILQVLETSHNRENLELQLKRLQEELTPIQSNNAKLLCDILTKARLDRTLRASSVSNNSCLTSREEEYTRKRSERLHRLEEESRQLISHIKRTSDRGYYLCCSVDRLRRQPNSDNNESYAKEETDNEGVPQEITSQNLNKTVNDVQVENELMHNEEVSLLNRLEEPLNKSIEEYETKGDNLSPLSKVEEAYTARRAARLQRLEKESKKLLSKLSSNAVRGNSLGERLDNLHERFTDNVLHPSTPSTLSQSASDNFLTIDQRINEIEEKSLKREARLRKLEEEGRQLINDLSETSKRGTQMINRIAERDAKTAQNQNKEKAGTSNEAISNSMIENIMPLAKNVALSSIVSEDLTQQVTVTSTPSQINTNKGAIPKTKPIAQLCAAQPKSARLQRAPRNAVETDETLEDMIKRLKAIPFPQQNQTAEDNESINNEKTNEESDKDKIV